MNCLAPIKKLFFYYEIIKAILYSFQFCPSLCDFSEEERSHVAYAGLQLTI